MSNLTENQDYAWEYNREATVLDNHGQQINLNVDAFLAGNVLRFVNHDDEGTSKN